MSGDLKPTAQFADEPLPRRLYLLTHGVRLSAGLAGFGAIVFSAFYFLGFAENDERAAHLLNAFIMCFGIGALIYGPAFIIARKAHRLLRGGAKNGTLLVILALMLPWIITGFYFQMLENPWNLIGSALIFLVFQYVWWGMEVSKSANTADKP